MWAILNKDSIVVDYVVGIPYEEVLKKYNNGIIINMTPENSPAFIGAYYDGKSFITKEIIWKILLF